MPAVGSRRRGSRCPKANLARGSGFCGPVDFHFVAAQETAGHPADRVNHAAAIQLSLRKLAQSYITLQMGSSVKVAAFGTEDCLKIPHPQRTTQDTANLQVGKGGLPSLKVQCHSILNQPLELREFALERGQAPFPTCKLPHDPLTLHNLCRTPRAAPDHPPVPATFKYRNTLQTRAGVDAF